MYRWRIDHLEMKEKQHEFLEEKTKSAVKLLEARECICTANTETGRDRARYKIMGGWGESVKTTTSRVTGKELIVCNRAVKWWDEGVAEA